jgi:hypothetical protein
MLGCECPLPRVTEVARRWLDVWVDSEGEPKPKRGIPRLFRKLAEPWGAKTLEPIHDGQRARRVCLTNVGTSTTALEL